MTHFAIRNGRNIGVSMKGATGWWNEGRWIRGSPFSLRVRSWGQGLAL